jgi:hypothetical protein
MQISGLVARLAIAALSGIITFIVFFAIGVVLVHFDATIGNLVKEFSPLIGLLAGVISFFRYPSPLSF